MKVIEISEKKLEKMSDLVEDMLLAGGELMHCLSKMEDEFYGERRPSRYMGMREPEHRDDWDEMHPMYGERRYSRRMR